MAPFPVRREAMRVKDCEAVPPMDDEAGWMDQMRNVPDVGGAAEPSGAAPAGGPGRAGEDGQNPLAVPWTLRQAIWGMCATLIPLLVLQGASLVAASRVGSTHAASSTARLPLAQDLSAALVILVGSAIIECVFLIAPLYYALKRRPAGTSVRNGLRALGLRSFAVARAVMPFVVGLIVVYGFGVLYDQLHTPTNANALENEALHAPISTLATLLVAVVVAPPTEELFFRGFVLPAFAKVMPVWAAIAASAVLFGIAHADLGSFLPLVVIGVVLGVLRWRTSSLWPGILFHALNNLIAAVAVLSVLHL
jgi:membrane protease YdiL (CAAX protease family)